MRRLVILFLFLLFVSTGTLFIATTDAEPLVKRSETISPNAIAQARRLFQFNDPRRMQAGAERRVALPAMLVDEGINSLANRMLQGRGAFALAEDSAELRLTLRIPWPRGLGERFLNLRARVNETQSTPGITAAAVGKLPIPARFAEFALLATIRSLGFEQQWVQLRGAVRRLTFEPERGIVLVDFVWQPALLDQVRSIAIDPVELPYFREAQEKLFTTLRNQLPGTSLSLCVVLKPLLAPTTPSWEHRRAALMVLAVYLANKNLAHLIPAAQQWPHPPGVTLTLRERNDTAQHFIISAALATWAGEPAAAAVGLYKELDDSRHGSGFSFADLAADRAGTRFGELVQRQPERLDTLLQSNCTDADLMPQLGDLPEYLSQREFQRRFGGANSPAYQHLIEKIEQRLNALPLYQ